MTYILKKKIKVFAEDYVTYDNLTAYDAFVAFSERPDPIKQTAGYKDGFYPQIMTNDNKSNVAVVDFDAVQPDGFNTYGEMVQFLQNQYPNNDYVVYPTISHGMEEKGNELRVRVIFRVDDEFVENDKLIAVGINRILNKMVGLVSDKSATYKNHWQAIYIKTTKNSQRKPFVHNGGNGLGFEQLQSGKDAIEEIINKSAGNPVRSKGLTLKNKATNAQGRAKLEAAIKKAIAVDRGMGNSGMLAMDVFALYLDEYVDYGSWNSKFFNYAMYRFTKDQDEKAVYKIKNVNEQQSEPFNERQIEQLINSARTKQLEEQKKR